MTQQLDSYKTAKALDVKEALESFIDSNSLSDVLTAIEEICYEKCEHLCSNWQDENAGAVWQKAARKNRRGKLRNRSNLMQDKDGFWTPPHECLPCEVKRVLDETCWHIYGDRRQPGFNPLKTPPPMESEASK